MGSSNDIGIVNLLILGAGSMAVEVLDIAEAAGKFNVLGFAVSVAQAPRALEGLSVYPANALPIGPADCRLVAGIVSTRRRGFVEEMAARGYVFESVVHPSALISPRSKVGTGCVIHPGVIVASNTVIGDHVMINRGALVGHDNRIEPFTTIGPGANVAGAVTVGPGAYLGAGCVVRDHLSIGAGAVIAAGAAVIQSVDANTLWAGVPAKMLRAGVDGL